MKTINKHRIQILPLFIFSLLLFGSCNDDETATPNNGFEVGGEFFATNFAYLTIHEFESTTEPVLSYEILFSSEELDLSNPDFLEDDFSSLDIVSIDIVQATAVDSPLPTGEIFHFLPSMPNFDQPSFLAVVLSDYDAIQEIGTLYDIDAGKLDITEDGEGYTISYRLVTANGEEIEGSFSGRLITE